MALSFSRPDPSSPDAIAAAGFSTSRRGYDQTEVRDLLRMVAAEMARLQEREKFLERELRTAQRGSTNSVVALDEEVVTRMLGEEAARILQTAREAASQIKIRSEDGASRMLREATDEAQRLREEAEVEAARRRQDASADAESELVMAKQQGREMVNEARAYRERVLSELARRRELARQQIEQLMHGRDRLLQAFERSRLVAVDVMAELTPLGEPAEYVNLAPTTGPVPLMVPNQRPPDGPVQDLPIAVVVEEPDDGTVDETATPEVPAADSDRNHRARGRRLIVVRRRRRQHRPADARCTRGARSQRARRRPQGCAGRGPVRCRRRRRDRGEPTAVSASVDDLFARLRAARAESIVERAQRVRRHIDRRRDCDSRRDAVATDDADATMMLTIVEDLAVFQASPEAPVVEEALDDTLFGQRDASLTPIIVACARKLKRVLADEQNEILHTLRRNEPVRTIDTMLPWETEQAARYAAAITAELEKAALIGAASIDKGTVKEHKADINRAGATKAAVEALTATIVAPLRERLERAVADAGRRQRRVGQHGPRSCIASGRHSGSTSTSTTSRAPRSGGARWPQSCPAPRFAGWSIPNGPACPDAEDNALAGEVAAGQPFPTGHTCAPAHEGCRCMLALAPR